MIEVSNLKFSYNSDSLILNGIDLCFSKGESWAVIGPSGCGKSTLLYLLAGLIKPQSGEIVIGGDKITRPRPETGLVLQDHGLLPWATVLTNIKMGFKIRTFYGPDGTHSPESFSLTDAQISVKVDYWLNWLGIDNLRNMYPSQLSRGQRQRVALARTLVLEPDLLLMDEPFSALDAPIREDLQQVMSRFHHESSLTSITVTHDIEEAIFLGEKILVLSNREDIAPVVLAGGFFGDTSRHDNPKFSESCQALKTLLAGVGGGDLK